MWKTKRRPERSYPAEGSDEMNEVSTTNPNEDVGPIYLEYISCTPESKAEWYSARCDQLKEMLREMAAQCREKDAELEALRKIAACFRHGDADRLEEMESWMIAQKEDAKAAGIDIRDADCEISIVTRMQAAAKLAEDLG
jgi:hypothetical protein